MNEQLRKAIEEATRVVDWHFDRGAFVHVGDHKASQAKLLRVIELLVEQRDAMYETEFGDDSLWEMEADAELIAALEGDK